MDPELWRCTILGANGPFAPKHFLKIINIILIYLLAPLILQNLKKNLPADPVMTICNFCAPNGPFPQMRIFFRKPVHQPCFFYSCLSTCQKSKSDINLLVKAKFQKKLMSQFRENLRKDGRKDRRMDGQPDGPYFIGPFRPRPGFQKESCYWVG